MSNMSTNAKVKLKQWTLKTFFKKEVRDICDEAVLDAVHPEFGWVWREGDYKEYLLQTVTNAMLCNVIVELNKL